MYEVESCYSNGDLVRALQQAAAFVTHVGEANVLHVVGRLDGNVPDAWWVDVIWRNPNPQR